MLPLAVNLLCHCYITFECLAWHIIIRVVLPGGSHRHRRGDLLIIKEVGLVGIAVALDHFDLPRIEAAESIFTAVPHLDHLACKVEGNRHTIANVDVFEQVA